MHSIRALLPTQQTVLKYGPRKKLREENGAAGVKMKWMLLKYGNIFWPVSRTMLGIIPQLELISF